MSYSIFESEPEESASYFLFSNSSIDCESGAKTGKRAIADSLRRRGMESQISDIMKVIQQFQEKYNPEWREALLRSLTAVNGPSPVFERFWAFWVNHFAVNFDSGE